MSDYEEKRAARIERLKVRAERLARAADASHDRAKATADMIPLGEPVKLGHHSQRRHERDLERIRAGYDRSVKLRAEAVAIQRRIRAAESNRTIYSDDPDAIDKLREKLLKLDTDRARMVAANKAVRSKDPRGALAALGFSPALVDQILTPDPMGRVGFPDYALRNRATEASRLRKRIAELEAKAAAPVREPLTIGDAMIGEAGNRVCVVFAGKPTEAVRAALKASGFRWAPSAGAWQRHASEGAWYAAQRILTTKTEAA